MQDGHALYRYVDFDGNGDHTDARHVRSSDFKGQTESNFENTTLSVSELLFDDESTKHLFGSRSCLRQSQCFVSSLFSHDGGTGSDEQTCVAACEDVKVHVKQS